MLLKASTSSLHSSCGVSAPNVSDGEMGCLNAHVIVQAIERGRNTIEQVVVQFPSLLINISSKRCASLFHSSIVVYEFTARPHCSQCAVIAILSDCRSVTFRCLFFR